jgi:hypothetical protein
MARYYYLEDYARLVKVEEGTAFVYREGGWHESGSAWAKVSGLDGADGREISAAEAETLVAEGRADGARFGWTEDDFASGGVYFHRAEEKPK